MIPILQYFTYEHLPENLQAISKKFALLAHWVVENTPQGPEQTTALRKLLEGKDCAVRASITKKVDA